MGLKGQSRTELPITRQYIADHAGRRSRFVGEGERRVGGLRRLCSGEV